MYFLIEYNGFYLFLLLLIFFDNHILVLAFYLSKSVTEQFANCVPRVREAYSLSSETHSFKNFDDSIKRFCFTD
jgi:hypothetical protein